MSSLMKAIDKPVLARLEKVDLREIWKTEASDFTPWLAQEENLTQLGDAIGIDLEHEATEKSVGPFKADILCKDTDTDHWVLIENQLERTDHKHLGQLLTYAAGLKAVTIVWIADDFTEEHRATIDWLNEITDERFNFFGLEIELWKIAGSPVAPKFNLAAKPNDWTKSVGPGGGRNGDGVASNTKLLQREYWKSLQQHMVKGKGVVKPRNPRPQHWMTFAIGHSKIRLNSTVNTQQNWISVGLNCYGNLAKPHFFALLNDKDAIERELGFGLDWRELPNKVMSKIMIRHDSDMKNESDWPNQHAWIAETLERMHQVFSKRVKSIEIDEEVLSE